MILQLEDKKHGLGNLRVSTYTYPIFNEFKTTFWIIIIILTIFLGLCALLCLLDLLGLLELLGLHVALPVLVDLFDLVGLLKIGQILLHLVTA